MHDAHCKLAEVDLNLLVTLDALLTERHVTRAARRLGLTQPAASHALARLREMFGDPLLVRGPGGVLHPTPRAEALAPAVHRALAELVTAVREPAAFDPATARRTFWLAANDYVELILLPRLVAHLSRIAPGIDLRVTTVIPESMLAAMAGGKLDMVLSPPRPEYVASCYQRALFDERFTCVVRDGHPAAARRLTLARFCELDHLQIAPRGTPGGFVDDALAALGRTRRVAVTVPHFLVAPHVVASTELILTLPSRMAEPFVQPLGLVVLPPPLEIAGFSMHMFWHERTHYDPGHRWFREQIALMAQPVRAERPLKE
ncbi:LysR family transcriptional regulator [Archangium violaceum]|uniref:LysR family transcriptional regulator n=1 Tax=Archangium violaceum TaxID=83451 RepID=UPI002B2F28AE|nr:LysR family transcriptional regulator [Archangium violaceum]